MKEQLLLNPIAKVDGEINLPGSKSLSNRALLLAALAKGTTTLTNLLDSDDIRHMLNALKKLGVNFQLSEDKKQCVVQGLGRAFNTTELGQLELFLGNAGTAMRPLCAALCLGEGEYVVTIFSLASFPVMPWCNARDSPICFSITCSGLRAVMGS